MIELSETQTVILAEAINRDDRRVFPLTTTNLKGGAVNKVLQSMLDKELIELVPAQLDDQRWADGNQTLIASPIAELALGIEEAGEADEDTQVKEPIAKSIPATAPSLRPTIRKGTKQQLLIDKLSTGKGATIDELVDATGWAKHTIRGAISGALKKKLALNIIFDASQSDGVKRYRIAS